jgi:DNA-binding response OmpR family regulator
MTLSLDKDLLAILRNGEPVAWLSPALFMILAKLNAADGKWVPQNDLVKALAAERRGRGVTRDVDEIATLKVQLCYLRRKIVGIASIESEGRGIGYRLVALPEVSTS